MPTSLDMDMDTNYVWVHHEGFTSPIDWELYFHKRKIFSMQ